MGRLCIILLMVMALFNNAEAKTQRVRKVAPAAITLYDHIQLKCKRSCVEQETLLKSVFHAVKGTPIDFRIVLAIIQVESAFNPKAKNGSNVGLSQVNLRYHRKKFHTKDPFDVHENVAVGVGILNDCLSRRKGSVKAALLCYNGHPYGDPSYVIKVMNAYQEIGKLIDMDRSRSLVTQEDAISKKDQEI